MTPEIKILFEIAESGPKGYNAYNRGTRTDAQGIRSIAPATREIDFSSLTLKEVMALQKLPKSNADSVFAVGLYQLTPDTTRHAMEALQLKGDEKFTPALQDKIFSAYLLTQKRPGIEAYIKNEGKNSLKSAQHELSKEWAGMPDPYKDGASHYGKGTSNKAHVELGATKAFLEELRADYTQLRKEGLSEDAAWAGLFDGRKIEHAVEVPQGATPSHTSAKPSAGTTKRPKEDEPPLFDAFDDLPIFKSMQGALGKIAGPDLGKRLNSILSKVDESAILRSIDKVTGDLAESPTTLLKALNEKYKSTMSKHVPVQSEPAPISAPVIPVPVKRADTPKEPLPAKMETPPAPAVRQNCASMDENHLRLMYQVQAHLVGEAGQKLGAMSEAESQRLVHAIVAEARISGFKHVAEVQVTQDRSGLIAFDGAPGSPASRRFYVDRAQVAAQSVEHSTLLINSVAAGIEGQFVETQNQTAQRAQR